MPCLSPNLRELQGDRDTSKPTGAEASAGISRPHEGGLAVHLAGEIGSQYLALLTLDFGSRPLGKTPVRLAQERLIWLCFDLTFQDFQPSRKGSVCSLQDKDLTDPAQDSAE